VYKGSQTLACSKVKVISCTCLCLYGAALYGDVIARDPTEPISSFSETTSAEGKEKEKKAVVGHVLEAILISGADKFAIINNKLVKVGDTVGTSKVKKIDSYQVTLVGETGETVLALFGSPIKKPVKGWVKEPAK
jgi:hypothetical protein